jgi:hypothetical protein
VLPAVTDVFFAATRRWIAGVWSPAQARLEIRLGGRLLDLPGDALARDAAQEQIILAAPGAGLSAGPAR